MDDKEKAHDEEEEDQEKQLVEIETDQRDAMKEKSSVRDEDFYRGAEPLPIKIQGKQKEHPSNKAEEKSEIDKVIDMICA
ncbi:hypothetical protein A2U01_0063568, partial [Trifolium medium]|nr:hypothetical protein [Trifolium medium]